MYVSECFLLFVFVSVPFLCLFEKYSIHEIIFCGDALAVHATSMPYCALQGRRHQQRHSLSRVAESRQDRLQSCAFVRSQRSFNFLACYMGLQKKPRICRMCSQSSSQSSLTCLFNESWLLLALWGAAKTYEHLMSSVCSWHSGEQPKFVKHQLETYI